MELRHLSLAAGTRTASCSRTRAGLRQMGKFVPTVLDETAREDLLEGARLRLVWGRRERRRARPSVTDADVDFHLRAPAAGERFAGVAEAAHRGKRPQQRVRARRSIPP